MTENLQVNPEVNEAVLSATRQFNSLIDDYITDQGLLKYRTVETVQQKIRFSREANLYVPQAYVRKFPPYAVEVDQDLSDEVCVPFSHRVAFGPFFTGSGESKNKGSNLEFMAVPEQGLLRNANIDLEAGELFSIGRVSLERYLDEVEAEALVEYVKNPALNVGRLVTVMFLNEDETSGLAEAEKSLEEFNEETRKRAASRVPDPPGGPRNPGSRYIRRRY